MKLKTKQFHTFKRGRVNSRLEARKQRVLINNLSKRCNKNLSNLFRKFTNTNLYLYKTTGIYEPQAASQRLKEDLFPVMMSHYRRVHLAVYKGNEELYKGLFKSQEAFVFGRSKEFESMIALYFGSKEFVLSGIADDMSKKILRLIGQGRADNLTLDQITRNVANQFLPISLRRANLIARTETHNAASFSNHKYHEQLQGDLGIEMVKKWVATSDERTRSFHAEVNGSIVGMDEKFLVGGARMAYAGDPAGGAKNVINCRCTVVYVEAEDQLDGDLAGDSVDGITDTVPKYVPKMTRGGFTPQGINFRDTVARALGSGNALKRIQETIKNNSKKWGVANQKNPRALASDPFFNARQSAKSGDAIHRFRGTHARDFGRTAITKTQLKNAGYTEFESKMFFEALDEALGDMNKMSEAFGIPPLRGLKSAGRNKRMNASMGDGVMNINLKNVRKYFMSKKIAYASAETAEDLVKEIGDAATEASKPDYMKLSKWTRADDAKDIPYSVKAYMDNGVDEFKALMYHEYGHHVHQSLHLDFTDLASYMNTLEPAMFERYSGFAEEAIKNRVQYNLGLKETGPLGRAYWGPSKYGNSQPVEWFAENFALWAKGGHDALISPQFLLVIEDFMEHGRNFNFGKPR